VESFEEAWMKRMDTNCDKRRPVGRVVGSFRSQKLAWTDRETGQGLEIETFAAAAVVRELEPLGFTARSAGLSDDDPPGGGERALGAGRMVLSEGPCALARGASVPPRATLRARLSPEEFLSGTS
jgi:hypothetical protein